MSILMWRCLSSPLQEPDPLFKVYVDKLVEELRLQKLSEPHVIERKWAGGRIWLIDELVQPSRFTRRWRKSAVPEAHLNIESLLMLLDLGSFLLEQWDCGADMNNSHSKGIYCSMCLGSITQARNEGKTPSNAKTPWEVVILIPKLVYKNKVNFSEACLLCWKEQFGTTWVSWDGGDAELAFPGLLWGSVGICGCLQGTLAPSPAAMEPSLSLIWSFIPPALGSTA